MNGFSFEMQERGVHCLVLKGGGGEYVRGTQPVVRTTCVMKGRTKMQMGCSFFFL